MQADVVRIAGDGLVIHHAIRGRIRSWERRTVEDLRVERPHLATLDDLFGLFPDAHWNVEVKSRVTIGPLVDALRRAGPARARVCVSSPFVPRVQAAILAEFGGEVCTCASLVEGALIGLPLLWPRRRHAAVQVMAPLAFSKAIQNWNHRRGTLFHVWPVNSKAGFDRARRRGVGAIITDRHELMAAEMRAAGLWPTLSPEGPPP